MSITSNIDDVLLSGKTSSLQPATPEHQPTIEPEAYEAEPEHVERETIEASHYENNEVTNEEQSETEATPEVAVVETDDYGNPKPAPRMYTEEEHNEEVNRKIRERLARGKIADASPMQQPQPAYQQQQYAGTDPNADWQQQLDARIDQRVQTMAEMRAQQAYEAQERQRAVEFEMKFDEGMSRFNDFTSVVDRNNVTPTILAATRALDNPAAFLYAASKNHNDEFKRIANLPDPYAQMVEIGKLDEKMRKAKLTTQAPKPLPRVGEDTYTKAKEKSKAPTIEDMIAQSNVKRLAQLNQRRR